MSSLERREASASPRFSIDFKALGPFLALVALFVLGTAINDAFLSVGTHSNIFPRAAFIGIIAVGATFVITAGGIDLSVGSMAAFISGAMIVVMNTLVETLGPGLETVLIGIVLSIILGIGAGAVNGLVSTKGKIEAFIVTLGTMGIYRSLVTYMADGGTLSLDFDVRGTYRPVYYGELLGIPVPVLVFLAVAVAGYVLLNMTPFGRKCFAIGSNEQVAPRLGSASSSTGVLWELEAIAAVIIGGTMLKGGYGRIWGTVVGAIMLTTIGNILNLTDAISNYLNGAVQGLIIIVAVFLQRGDWRRKKSK